MIRILRKYNKKILAVIGVFLMIAFIVPSVAKRGGMSRYNVQATIGGKPVSPADYVRATNDWHVLTGQDMQFPQITGYGPDGRPQGGIFSLMELTLGSKLAGAYGQVGGLQIARQIVRRMDDMTFLALLKEAQGMNVRVSQDTVQSLLQQLNARPAEDPAAREQAVTDWLTVVAAFDHLGSAVKVTPAMATAAIAQSEEQVSLKLVDFKAQDFRAQVPEPTNAQLQEFFAKYRDTDPETNEYGFGYRFPNRVKIEYIKVPHDKVLATVTDVDAAEVWRHSPQNYPTTQPASQPTTQPAGAAARPSTRPTTRPFAEVKEQIKNELADRMAGNLARAMQRTMNLDYQSARAGAPTLPAELPPSSLGVAYNSPGYPRRLAEQAQKQKDARGVLPETVSDPTFQGRTDLTKIPGLGQSFIISGGGRFLSFADYLMNNADPFLTESQRNSLRDSGSQPLALWQPSMVLRDIQGDYYVVRMTAVEPAHAAPSLDSVWKAVKDDWTTYQAYQKAGDAARKALEQARKEGLEKVAQANGREKAIDTGLFYESADGRTPIPNYSLPPQAQAAFVKGAFGLLHERLKSGPQHPYGLIDLPRTATYVVAQLDDAKPAIEHEYFSIELMRAQQQLEARRSAELMFKWFDPEEVAQRLDFKSGEKRRGGQAPPPPADEPPPLF